MQYTKQAIDFSDQLSLLKQRGLIIDDEDKALRCLHSISYFRLTSYLVPMESDSDTHAFRPKSHLHTAIALYNFDQCYPFNILPIFGFQPFVDSLN